MQWNYFILRDNDFFGIASVVTFFLKGRSKTDNPFIPLIKHRISFVLCTLTVLLHTSPALMFINILELLNGFLST